MATEVRRRRGTSVEHSTFTGAVAELTVDLTKDTVVVHDGATQGGFPLLREDLSNVPTTAPFTNISLDTAIFDTNYTADGNEAQGTLYWNDDELTLSLVTNGETIELGQKVEINVKNQTGSQINKGEVVYASGTVGNSGRILVDKMIADGTIAAKRILGVAAENIANGADGKVIKFGKLRKVNTNAYNEGDILWVSASTAGAFQTTEPVQADGEIALPIAFVVTKSSSVGEIFIRVTPIDENEYQDYDAGLQDIAGLTPTDSNIIVGDGTNWVAESGDTARTSLGLGTGDSPTFTGLTVNGSITVTGNVDGRDISDDGADLDELYTTIGLSDLTSHEVDQLENIGDLITISNTQWTYLGELDQSLTSNTSVQFNNITLTGTVKTNEIDAQADLIWDDTNNTEVWNLSDYYVNNAVNIGSNVYITDELDVEEDVRIGNSLTVSGSVILSSNATIGGNLTLSGSADFNSTMNLQGNLTTQANLADDGFSSGWAGTNWQIQSDGYAEFQELRVRGALRVYEFIAKQISTIGGTELLSIAQGRVESVDVNSGVIYLENLTDASVNSFADFDLFIIQSVNINSGNVRSIYGEVNTAELNELNVTVTSGSLSDIEQGDVIVAYGNSSNTDRQAIMYRNVDRSEDNLIMRLQTGIDSFSALQDEDNTRVAFGDLNGYSGLNSETFGFFAGDNSAGHILATSSGLFLKDGSTTLAELTSNTFKVGDGTNFLSFDGTDLDIQTDSFTLETTNLSIDSDAELITIGSADSVSLGKKLNLAASSDTDYRDSLNKYGSTVDFYGLYLNPENYFGFVQDDDGNVADGYNFRVGGATSNYIEVNGATGDVSIKFDTFDLDSSDLVIDSSNSSITLSSSGFLEDSGSNYRLNADGLKINTYGLSSKANISIAGSIAFGQYTSGYALTNYGSYIGSYNNGGTISKQDSTLYLYGTRAVHIDTDEGIIILDNLPTSSSGLPTGAIYNDSGTLKIA